MSVVIHRCTGVEELRQALVIGHYFGADNLLEDAARLATVLPVERMHGAWEDGRAVGGAGAYPVELSLPGGRSVASAGVTVVGVAPTHRRRGILTAMMRAQLDDVQARGEAVAWLWASEGPIYGRFGYGLASVSAEIDLVRERTAFADLRPVWGRARAIDQDEALARIPPLYDRVRAQHAGMVGRSRAWWEVRRLSDHPMRRGNAGPLQRVLIEREGEAVGYALYRIRQQIEHHVTAGSLIVVEAMGIDPEAIRTAWRFLLDMDWVARIRADCLPVDHPLQLLLAEPRRLEMRLADGVWVRLVDVAAALSARAYGTDEALVIEVVDAFCPWNSGRFRLADGRARRTDQAAELQLAVDALGSAYLGGFSFHRLHEAGRVQERVPGALARADRLFRTERAPWCPEVF